MKRLFQWLVSPARKSDSNFHVVLWWEIRRIPFNIIVGSVGFVSLLLFYYFIDHSNELEPGEDAVEPIALVLAPILANIFYTGGWMAELFFRGIWKEKVRNIGPALLKLGLSFSLFVVLLPSVLWFFTWIARRHA